jgi:hypothetical protein
MPANRGLWQAASVVLHSVCDLLAIEEADAYSSSFPRMPEEEADRDTFNKSHQLLSAALEALPKKRRRWKVSTTAVSLMR